ncbi:MAG: FxsA family protein [Candidatus Omnitrophota bacterium]
MGCFFLCVFFITFPIAEFNIMLKVAAHIGFWDTFVLCVFSALMGLYLAKHQGIVVMTRMQACLSEGRPPTREMLDGLLVFLGGILFVLPGFLSDALGLILVFPLTRALVRMALIAGFKGRLASASAVAEGQVKPVQKSVAGQVDRGAVEDAEVLD